MNSIIHSNSYTVPLCFMQHTMLVYVYKVLYTLHCNTSVGTAYNTLALFTCTYAHTIITFTSESLFTTQFDSIEDQKMLVILRQPSWSWLMRTNNVSLILNLIHSYGDFKVMFTADKERISRMHYKLYPVEVSSACIHTYLVPALEQVLFRQNCL